jgi:hypothetical protein
MTTFQVGKLYRYKCTSNAWIFRPGSLVLCTSPNVRKSIAGYSEYFCDVLTANGNMWLSSRAWRESFEEVET